MDMLSILRLQNHLQGGLLMNKSTIIIGAITIAYTGMLVEIGVLVSKLIGLALE
jgi:hypothetical protein